MYLCVRIDFRTATASRHSINWPAFITQKESVYSEVRTESLGTIQFNLLKSSGYFPYQQV